MYAIVEIAGQQFKVEEGKKIFVHRLESGKDDVIEFEKVLLVEDNDKILVGEPVIKDFIVEGKVLEQVRGDKVIVFKKKRKKGYRVKNGHRQNFTQIEITGIGLKGAIVRKQVPKKETVRPAKTPSAEEHVPEIKAKGRKTVAKKAEVKNEEPSPKEKKTTAKKVTEKKPSAKKPSKKKE